MSLFSRGPATAKSACGRKASSTTVLRDTYDFDPPTARRLAFVRWLVATGRLDEWARATPARADALLTTPTPARVA